MVADPRIEADASHLIRRECPVLCKKRDSTPVYRWFDVEWLANQFAQISEQKYRPGRNPDETRGPTEAIGNLRDHSLD